MRNPLSLLVAAAIATACGHGDTPASPSAATASGGGAATISGRVLPGSNVNTVSIAGSASSLRSALTDPIPGRSALATELSSPVDASGRFALNNVPAGNVQLQFVGPGTNARLTLTNVAPQEDIHLTVRVSGSSAELDDNRRQTADNRVEVEGKVVEVNVAGRTLKIGDTVVSVPPGTPITGNNGSPVELSAIPIGDRVEVKGSLSGSTVVASSVKLESDRSEGPGGNSMIELSGTVAGKSGACPAIAFMVGTTPVTTSAATRFEDGSCASIVNGARVEVKGTRQPNGSVAATSVEADDDKDDDEDEDGNEVELKGALSAKTGTCPGVTLTVGSTSVLANASTRYEDTSCTALALRDSVEVDAVRQPNGLLLAKKVEKR